MLKYIYICILLLLWQNNSSDVSLCSLINVKSVFQAFKDWENYRQINKNYYFKHSFHFRLDDDLTWKTLLYWKRENCLCHTAFSQTESMWRHVLFLFVYIKPSDSSSNRAPKCIQTTAKNKRKQGNWRICCQWTCMCAFVCVCVYPSQHGRCA